MIKRLLGITAFTLLLGGCVAVPVYPGGGPAYGYIAPPPVAFSFGYSNYRGGYGPGRGYGYGSRHWH